MTGPECAPSTVNIRLFGPLEVRVNGVPLPRLRSRKGQSLLALLALRAGCAVERTWLAGLLWPDTSTSHALALLRRDLTDLRRALGPAAERLRSPTPRTLCLDLAAAEVDVRAFDTAIASGEVAGLERAVASYRGPLLEGWVEEWLLQERQVREEAYLSALATLAEEARRRGDIVEAVRHLRRVVTTDPLRESARRDLMAALAAGGNEAAATETYRELRLHLHQALNAAPDAETTALYERIRAEARSKAALGAHRWSEAPAHNLPRQLTRFIGREQQTAEIQRLLPATSLLTLTGPGGCGKTRLALQVAADLVEHYPEGVWLVELAALSDPALVPQTIAAALGLQEQPGRPPTERLVEDLRARSLLLVLDNCEHLLSACAQLAEHLLRRCPGLRILATSRERLNLGGEVTYRVPSLTLPDLRRLTAREGDPTLHLSESEAARLFIERASSSQPRFLLTPGNALAIAEVCHRLDGIPLAIELAAARVRALPVEQLAVRLDDCFRLLTGGCRTALPRQQTLQATMDWSYHLLPEPERALLRRLSVFAGGWTLAAAEWGCSKDGSEVLDLLTSLVDKSLVLYEEQDGEGRYRLLETVRQYGRARLWEEGEAAEARRSHRDWVVALAEQAGPGLGGGEQAAWLERLEREHDNLRAALDWSLETGEAEVGLRIGASVWRFWHIRGYWEEGGAWLARLLVLPETQGSGAASPRAKERRDPALLAVRAKVLEGAAALATPCSGPNDKALARSFLEEMLAIGEELGDRRIIGRALGGLGAVTWGEGSRKQGCALIEQSLMIAREVGDQRQLAWALKSLAIKIGGRLQCDGEAAWRLYEESLAILRELGDKAVIGLVLGNMGDAAQRRGDDERARGCWEETLAINRELGDRDSISWILLRLGRIAWCHGDYRTASARFEEMRAAAQEARNRSAIASSLRGLGLVRQSEGHTSAARSLLEESLARFRELGDRWRLPAPLNSLGEVARCQGDDAGARSLFEESLTILGELERKTNGIEGADCRLGLGRMAQKQGDAERAAALYRESLALYQEARDRHGGVRTLEAVAELAGARGHYEEAARLFGAAEAAREALRAPLPPVERAGYEAAVAVVRAALEEDDFRTDWAQGAALPLEDAIAEALREAELAPAR